MKENERNQIWFSPEMLESMKRQIWLACWRACCESDGTKEEMKVAYQKWSLEPLFIKESYEDQTEEA